MLPTSSTKSSWSIPTTPESARTAESTGSAPPARDTESSEVSLPPAERPEDSSREVPLLPSLDLPSVDLGKRETPRNSGATESTEHYLNDTFSVQVASVQPFKIMAIPFRFALSF